MRLHLLGTAAGGGLPQWNCACVNCRAARLDPSLARSQCQLAVSATGADWILVNASPDLRDQLFRTPALHPRPEHGLRNIPVAGVVLTSADLDHILGLLLMREFTPVSIYATASVLSVLEANPFFSMLARVPGQKRTEVICEGLPFAPLEGMTITPIGLPGCFPAHVSTAMRAGLRAEEMTLGMLFTSDSGKRAAYLPALPSWSEPLLVLLRTCDIILVDGTLWSEDELQRLQPGTPAASEMGHLPIGGLSGSLTALKELSHARRIYTHINNSNPIVRSGSEEQNRVLDAGIEIGYDGMILDF